MFPGAPHTDGKRFFNPGEKADRGFLDLLRWKLTAKPKAWPEHVGVKLRPVPPAAPSDGVGATWIGHATFLLRSASVTVLTDPIFSERASPVSWAGPRRVVAPGVPFVDLPKVDLVLLSHDHFDHCDLPTLRRLALRDNPVILAPLGHKALLAGAGVRRVIELDWWQRHIPAPGIEVMLVPALHWCRRSPFSTNIRLWGGFMTKMGGRLVYFAGDSGYDETLFTEIGKRCGRPDLALVPIGAYEPRWFMKDAHMNPAEAVRAHVKLGAVKSVAMHWGTFQMTDEGREEPIEALGAACKAESLGADDFEVLDPGESTDI